MPTDPTFLPRSGTFGVAPSRTVTAKRDAWHEEPTPRLGAVSRGGARRPGVETLLAGMPPVREEPIPHPKGPESASSRAARFVTTVGKRQQQRRNEWWWSVERRARRLGWPLLGGLLLVVAALVLRSPRSAPTKGEDASRIETSPSGAPLGDARARRDEIPPPDPAVEAESAVEEGATTRPTATGDEPADPVRTEATPSSPSRARRTIPAPAHRSDFSRSQ